MNALPPILDATCGGRMIWWQKDCKDAIFCDFRKEEHHSVFKGGGPGGVSPRHIRVAPDVVSDFRHLPFPDNSFHLAVMDPPHLVHVGDTSWTAKAYGKLEGDWRGMLRDGFAEVMRVLKPFGTLCFKWSETQVPAGEVWKAIGSTPLFGTRTGRKAGTIWAVFMKGVPS